MSKFVASKLPFFPRVSANIQQLADKARHQLLAREDVQKLRAVSWYLDELAADDPLRNVFGEDKYSFYDAISSTLTGLPDEGFKLFPWVVREFKKGAQVIQQGQDRAQWNTGITFRNIGHAKDILNQAIEWLVYAREHNTPVPDMMAKDFDMNKLADWVLEMHHANVKHEWVDSTPVKTFPDGWQIVEVGEEDLPKEGEEMGHCVGGYQRDVRNGELTIYSLRDPNGEPHITMEVTGVADINGNFPNGRFNIVQQQGKQNRQPKPEYQKYVDEWLNKDISPKMEITEGEDEHADPDEEWVDHPAGSYDFETPESVFDYHDIMTNQYDRDEHFDNDEDPELDEQRNTYYWRNPREITFPEHLHEVGTLAQPRTSLAPILTKFMQTLVSGKPDQDAGYEDPYDADATSQFVQGLWMAVQHYGEQFYGFYGRGEGAWKGEWQYLTTVAENFAKSLKQPEVPEPARAPQLFDPNTYNTPAKGNPVLDAMVRYMEELEDAPTQWEQPATRNTFERFTDENGNERTRMVRDEEGNPVQEPYTINRTMYFPGSGGQSTDFGTYFDTVGMPGLHMPGTIAALKRLAHTTDWNFNPGGYEGEVNCPLCGHELEIQLEGGASCPRCGSKYEVGRSGVVIPPDESVDEMSKQWPDTLPWSNAEQDYYRDERKAMAQRSGDPTLDKLIEEYKAVDFPYDPDRTLPMQTWADPHEAQGMCGEVSTHFHDWITERGYQDETMEITDGTWQGDALFDDVGYGDRKPGEQGHLVNIVTTPGGQKFMIDWTASQYGYTEFPMVQKLDEGEQWQRKFAVNSGDFGLDPGLPYPFLYEPESGWLMWGNQGGFHDQIHEDLARQGMKVPNGHYDGRWFPKNDVVSIYDHHAPLKNVPKHNELIRRNAPQDARGSFWDASGDDAPEDWASSMSLDDWH